MNFEFSLIDEEGKIIQFKTGEDKIPALNFTIQIINWKCLKVKDQSTLQKKNNNNNNKHETEINEIKSAIKNVFLTNQKNKKSLNDYSQLVTKIRNEYNILVKENQALKTQLEQYKNYDDANIAQRQKKPDVSYRKWKPNYRYSYHNDEDDDDEDEELKNNYYISKIKNKKLKKNKKNHI